jgi:hypothetical protein
MHGAPFQVKRGNEICCQLIWRYKFIVLIGRSPRLFSFSLILLLDRSSLFNHPMFSDSCAWIPKTTLRKHRVAKKWEKKDFEFTICEDQMGHTPNRFSRRIREERKQSWGTSNRAWLICRLVRVLSSHFYSYLANFEILPSLAFLSSDWLSQKIRATVMAL